MSEGGEESPPLPLSDDGGGGLVLGVALWSDRSCCLSPLAGDEAIRVLGVSGAPMELLVTGDGSAPL